MTEESLKQMSTNQLIDLMIITVNEIIVLNKVHDHKHADERRQEIEMIQKIIVERRANETPLK